MSCFLKESVTAHPSLRGAKRRAMTGEQLQEGICNER